MQSRIQQSNQPKRFPLVRLMLMLLVIGLAAFAWLNQQLIYDTVRFWQYEPTSSMVQLTDRMELTDTGSFLFYASHPSLDEKQSFNTKCERRESGTAILGCYDGRLIHIYDIEDKRLDGIKEVTASHEMLHAAYQRLTVSEKRRVNELIEDEYRKLRNDPKLADRMEFYARTEPGERDNELHSIIGTEVTSISPELENHYSKYFKNRSRIVSLHNSYNQIFLNLENQATLLSERLSQMGKERDGLIASYEASLAVIEGDISQFNNRADSNYFSSQSEFNRQRAALVDRVDRLEIVRGQIASLTETYNNLVEEYNKTVLQSGDLYKSLDSSVMPAPKV